MKKSKRVVVVGSSNTDMIVNVERIPAPGETILGGEFSMAAGGKGANQAVAVARIGGDASLVARVGDDTFGNQAIENFRKDGIDVSQVKIDESEASGVALINVAASGENSISVASGANSKLSENDVEAAAAAIESAGAVLTQLETPLETVERLVRLSKEKGVPLILNPAPARALSDELLKDVAVITPNESEAEILTGIKVIDVSTAKQAAASLREKGVGVVIITLGAKGAYVSCEDHEQLIEGFPVEPIDTTAAGDTFNGAFASEMAKGELSILDMIRFANAAAAMSVTRAGAQPSIPRRGEVERFLKSGKIEEMR
ncbi:MAG: ribokinase [Verrucomicrobiota bacterium]